MCKQDDFTARGSTAQGEHEQARTVGEGKMKTVRTADPRLPLYTLRASSMQRSAACKGARGQRQGFELRHRHDTLTHVLGRLF